MKTEKMKARVSGTLDPIVGQFNIRRRDMTHDEQMRIAAAVALGWSGPWRFGNTHLHGTPPNAEKPATGWPDDKHVPEKVDALVHQLCNQITTLAAGIEAVRALMDESHGVAGLHKNGDVVPWEELEENGRLWEWLFTFNDAERVLPNAGVEPRRGSDVGSDPLLDALSDPANRNVKVLFWPEWMRQPVPANAGSHRQEEAEQ